MSGRSLFRVSVFYGRNVFFRLRVSFCAGFRGTLTCFFGLSLPVVSERVRFGYKFIVVLMVFRQQPVVSRFACLEKRCSV